MGYISIPNLYKDQTILMFRKAIAMEKVHGCFIARTNIRMVDGSRRRISDIEVGDEVLGVDESGAVVPTRVTQIFKNNKTNEWLTVKGTRRGAGRGPALFSVNCTPNHRFWNPQLNMYVPASALRVRDAVTVLRNDRELRPLQYSTILGKLLGDGYLSDSRWSASLQWGHSEEDRTYVEWTAQALGELALSYRYNRTSGFDTPMIQAHTAYNAYIKEEFSSFYSVDGKRVPEWVADKLDPISIAFWYMDDGALSHDDGQEDRATFAVCNFNEKDCEVLVKGLARFGIHAVYFRDSEGYSRLRLNEESAERLFLLVAPYIPEAMQRKLPERYREHIGWLPKLDTKYRPLVVEQEIVSVEPYDKGTSYYRYDLETETHNYFAGEVLVHNSSAHVGHRQNTENAGLHFFSGGESHDRFVAIFDQAALAERFVAFGHQEIVVFGEVYGGKCQGMKHTYGPDLSFIGFDVKIGDNWLSVPQAHKVCNDLGIEFVPYEEVSTDLDELNRVRDKPSEIAVRRGMGADKQREGVVLRPLVEMTKNNGDRVIAKHKQDSFSERATPQKVIDPSKLEVLAAAEAITTEWVTLQRLQHVLQKLPTAIDMTATPIVIKAMVEDVYREAKGEVVESKEATAAIGKRTAKMYKEWIATKALG